jgi:predicted enzyme related to lactoylglutathione lyase
MGERTSYAPGTFSWVELATSDAAAAKAFYTAVFGWSYEDNPVPDGPVYSMALRDGKRVAALYESTQEGPPHWNNYVTVDSVDAAAARAAELGANVVAAPFDVMDVGRMAVIADPTGASLCLWEARGSIGAELVNAPGALSWNDLLTTDIDAAAAFYSGLFGWRIQESGGGSPGYRAISNGDRGNGGMMPSPGDYSAWIPYFGHEDVDALAGGIGVLGGQLYDGPWPIGDEGRIAVFADPQGAAFMVWTGIYDD